MLCGLQHHNRRTREVELIGVLSEEELRERLRFVLKKQPLSTFALSILRHVAANKYVLCSVVCREERSALLMLRMERRRISSCFS